VQLVGGYGEESESEAEQPGAVSAEIAGGIDVLGGYESEEVREADSIDEELGKGLNTPDS